MEFSNKSNDACYSDIFFEQAYGKKEAQELADEELIQRITVCLSSFEPDEDIEKIISNFFNFSVLTPEQRLKLESFYIALLCQLCYTENGKIISTILKYD